MAKLIDKKTLLSNIKKTDKRRAKATFTLDADVYRQFKAECDKQKVAQSRVLEELIKSFIEKE